MMNQMNVNQMNNNMNSNNNQNINISQSSNINQPQSNQLTVQFRFAGTNESTNHACSGNLRT